jgi:hypothetical protein
MTSADQDSDRSEILRVLNAYHSAMVGARIDDLDGLLDQRYSLVHISGYVQPKDEWFDVIRSGEFDYHRIDVDERTLAVKVTGTTATVTGQGIFNATINGFRRPWRLQFTLWFSKRNERWIITGARYTSF